MRSLTVSIVINAILRSCEAYFRQLEGQERKWKHCWSTLAFSFAIVSGAPAAFAGTTVTVGNPSSPNALGAAINSAYTGGATTIIVAPGTYTIGASGDISINRWSNATISCYGCTFVTTDPNSNDSLWAFSSCTNVTFTGGTITCSTVPMWETKVTSLGAKDGSGYQTYNIAQVTGYPAAPTGTKDITTNAVDGNSRQYKPFTGDAYSSTVTSTGTGTYNVDFNQSYALLSVGDYVVGRYTYNPYKIDLYQCSDCTIENVIMYVNAFSAIREDNCTGDTFNHNIWAAGPPPSGATDPPLFSCNADGSDALADYTGPIYENCEILQLLNDDDIAVHGYNFPLNSVNNSGQATVITVLNSVVAEGNQIVAGEPIRWADATIFGQGTMSSVSDSNGVWTITLDKNYNIPSDVYIYNPDVCGANYKITNCLLGSTRSRGIIAKADNGLIENNTIINPGIDAVRVGNEGWNTGEAGFANGVQVLDNVIDGCGSFQNGGDGALHVGTTGATGNLNYLFENNVVSNSVGPSATVEGGNGIQISNNTFANTSQYSQSDDEHLLNVTTSTGVTMANNLLTNRGANSASPYYEIDSGSTNINTSGLTTGMYSSGLYSMNHYTTNQNIDVPGNSSSAGTDLVTEPQAQDTEQSWVATNALSGFYTLTHLGTDLVMDVSGNSKTPGMYVDQATYSGGTNDQWSIADQGNGTELVTNDYSGLVVDAYGNSGSNGTAIDEYTSNGGNNQRWAMWLAGASAGPNLVQNFSFEANNGYTQTPTAWTITGSPAVSAYVQPQGISEDGNNCLVFYNSVPYNATTYQNISNLPNGYYTLTAYVMASANMNQAYMFAYGYGTSAPELYGSATPGAGVWQKVTIADIPVTNGQCTFGFYGQTGVAYSTFFVDNVVLTRQFSSPLQVDLTPNLNDIGIFTDGTAITTGGFDGSNYGLSNNLLGSGQSWDGENFNFGGGLNNYNVVACDGSTVSIPPSPYTYSTMYVLAAGVNGAQTGQNFSITYNNGAHQTITQSFSDWAVSSNFSGESTAVAMSYRDNPNGAKGIPVNVYGYAFSLDNTRMPLGINLPINSNLRILAITLAP